MHSSTTLRLQRSVTQSVPTPRGGCSSSCKRACKKFLEHPTQERCIECCSARHRAKCNCPSSNTSHQVANTTNTMVVLLWTAHTACTATGENCNGKCVRGHEAKYRVQRWCCASGAQAARGPLGSPKWPRQLKRRASASRCRSSPNRWPVRYRQWSERTRLCSTGNRKASLRLLSGMSKG